MSGMFDIKNLSDFLSENVDLDLFPRAFVMSRNGKLIAYSTPYDVSQVKAEAAVVAMAWKSKAPSERSSKPLTGVVTIRSRAYTISAKSIQANLLLVLVGCNDDVEGQSGFRITHDSFNGSEGAQAEGDAEQVQRHKLDNMTETILAEATFLEMPEDGQYGLLLH